MNRIAALRRERGLTQQELGDKLGGLTKYAVSKWENGDNEPSQSIIKQLCDILGADSDYLMGHSDKNTRRVELSGKQVPENLRAAGLEYVSMLKEYIDESGGILPEVQKELLRLVAEAQLLPESASRSNRSRKYRNPK